MKRPKVKIEELQTSRAPWLMTKIAIAGSAFCHRTTSALLATLYLQANRAHAHTDGAQMVPIYREPLASF